MKSLLQLAILSLIVFGCTSNVEHLDISSEMPESYWWGASLYPVNNDVYITQMDGYYVFDTKIDTIRFAKRIEISKIQILDHDQIIIVLSTNEISAHNISDGMKVWGRPLKVNYTGMCFFDSKSIQLVANTSGNIELLTLDLNSGEEVSLKPFYPLGNDNLYNYLAITEDYVVATLLKSNSIWCFKKDKPDEVLWKIALNNRFYEDENLLVTNKYLLIADGQKLKSFAIESGELVATYDAPYTMNNLKYHQGKIYVLLSGGLACLDPDNLTELYRASTGPISNPYFQKGSFIYFTNKELKVLDLSIGNLTEKFDLDPVVSVTNAVYVNGQYVFISQDGELIRVSE